MLPGQNPHGHTERYPARPASLPRWDCDNIASSIPFQESYRVYRAAGIPFHDRSSPNPHQSDPDRSIPLSGPASNADNPNGAFQLFRSQSKAMRKRNLNSRNALTKAEPLKKTTRKLLNGAQKRQSRDMRVRKTILVLAIIEAKGLKKTMRKLLNGMSKPPNKANRVRNTTLVPAIIRAVGLRKTTRKL